MKRRNEIHYIQPDARGRIQLPKELREFQLFKFFSKDGKYELTPLRFEEEPSARTGADSIWLTPEVNQYLEENLFPTLHKYFQTKQILELAAVFLYGSRARGDALSKSDFDLGLLFEKYPTSQERHEISDALHVLLKDEFATLKAHGVDSEPSIHFFSTKFSAETLPPIYFSIFTDGRMIWQRRNGWETFIKSIKKVMNRKKVISCGQGKSRKWIWEAG